MNLRRFLLLCSAFLITSCVYEFPITVEPARKIDPQLIGNWLAEKPEDDVEIRKFDDSHYVLRSGGKLYRAYFSEVNGVTFANIQTIDPVEPKERKYWFVAYELLDDGMKLVVRSVNQSVVPEAAKSSQEIEKLIADNLKNPQLFNAEKATYRKRAKAGH